jgi:hypothetical protein
MKRFCSDLWCMGNCLLCRTLAREQRSIMLARAIAVAVVTAGVVWWLLR